MLNKHYEGKCQDNISLYTYQGIIPFLNRLINISYDYEPKSIFSICQYCLLSSTLQMKICKHF